MAGRLRRTVAAVSLVALLLPLAAATSLAAESPTEVFKFSDNGYSAGAGESGCDVEGDIETCTFTSIFVFSGNRREHGLGTLHGTEVCYDTGTDVFNLLTGEVSSIQESGCSFDPGEGTIIERDLSAATIAPTTVTVETFSCDEIECGHTGETRDVTVEGTFTATSTVTRESLRDVFDDGVCTNRFSARGTSREAMFTGTVDGEPREFGGETGCRSTKAQAASARSARSKPEVEYATGPHCDEGRWQTGVIPCQPCHDRPSRP